MPLIFRINVSLCKTFGSRRHLVLETLRYTTDFFFYIKKNSYHLLSRKDSVTHSRDNEQNMIKITCSIVNRTVK